jgi:hypothetical protein
MNIASLFIYPIKGCRGHAVATAAVDGLGLGGDRRLMLVDLDGQFLTQRDVPALATFEPLLYGSALRVTLAGHDPLEVEVNRGGPEMTVRVWDDTLIAHDQGARAAAWFTGAIGRPCRLVAFGAASFRPLNPKWVSRPGPGTTFADAYPALAVLDESLADLNRRLATPVPMSRFRPSMVVTGASAWSEDAWRELAIGDFAWNAVKPCDRCVVTTTDQVTGARDPRQEPLRTLAKFRNFPGLGVIFGQNLVPRTPGTLNVGDLVVTV